MAKPPLTFSLRFPTKDIGKWSEKYQFDDNVPNKIGPTAKTQGYLTKKQFQDICEWKTPRARKKREDNEEGVIQEATQLALAARNDAVKMGILRSLNGVEWPTASVILHFCDTRPYPIIDFRTLWSLGYDKPPLYTTRFWLEYTAFVRKLSESTGHSMRTIDRALWQFSKENQKTD